MKMVSESVAIFFYEQCHGEHTGHMEMLDNNPVLKGLLKSHGVNSQKDFIDFIRRVANRLSKKKDLPF